MGTSLAFDTGLVGQTCTHGDMQTPEASTGARQRGLNSLVVFGWVSLAFPLLCGRLPKQDMPRELSGLQRQEDSGKSDGTARPGTPLGPQSESRFFGTRPRGVSPVLFSSFCRKWRLGGCGGLRRGDRQWTRMNANGRRSGEVLAGVFRSFGRNSLRSALNTLLSAPLLFSSFGRKRVPKMGPGAVARSESEVSDWALDFAEKASTLPSPLRPALTWRVWFFPHF